MNFNNYIVTLTNGTVNSTYKIQAMNKREAVILAQAEAIQLARGYELVSIESTEKYKCIKSHKRCDYLYDVRQCNYEERSGASYLDCEYLR